MLRRDSDGGELRRPTEHLTTADATSIHSHEPDSVAVLEWITAAGVAGIEHGKEGLLQAHTSRRWFQEPGLCDQCRGWLGSAFHRRASRAHPGPEGRSRSAHAFPGHTVLDYFGRRTWIAECCVPSGFRN